jgi:hypothetical protein
VKTLEVDSGLVVQRYSISKSVKIKINTHGLRYLICVRGCKWRTSAQPVYLFTPNQFQEGSFDWIGLGAQE